MMHSTAHSQVRRAALSLSQAELDALGVSTDVVTAGRGFGMSRDAAYDAAASGTFPCPVVRVGKRWVVPTAGLRRALGIEVTGAASRSV